MTVLPETFSMPDYEIRLRILLQNDWSHTFQEHNLLVLMTHLSRLSWKKVMTPFLDLRNVFG